MSKEAIKSNKPQQQKEKTAVKGVSPWSLAGQRLKKNKLALFGLFVLSILILLSISAPILAPHGRDTIDMFSTNRPPSSQFWLGTDGLGRDIFTRLLYGGQVSLSVGLIATGISLSIGLVLGSTSGYFGGKADMIIMRLVDVFMSFPFLVLAISVAAILGPSYTNTLLIIGILGWTIPCRIVRAEILSLKEREFIEAARALGLESYEIIAVHLLPNIMAPIIVYSTLGIAGGILAEAGLSFLGFGVRQPMPSWGNMLTAAQSLRALENFWWQWVPPGLLVFLTVLSINFFGDGLRDALDPKLKQ